MTIWRTKKAKIAQQTRKLSNLLLICLEKKMVYNDENF